MCDSFRDVSDVRYSHCRNRLELTLVYVSVGISFTGSVWSNKVRVVVVLTENVVQVVSLVL